MNAAQYVVDFLANKGIDTAFLVQGACNNELIYAIADHPKMRYVCTMHEQAAGFAAEGYAKVKGVPGLAIATSGPGGQNLVTPIANCFYDSVSCIFITGQVNTQFQRQDTNIRQLGFQEWPVIDVVYPIVKRAVMVRNVRWLKQDLEGIWNAVTTGRPGPVLIDLPVDVQAAEVQ